MLATNQPTKARRLRMATLLPLLLAPALHAQPAPSQPASPSDETVMLSPFDVDTSKDQGYYASSTLAGTRINTDLKDIASPISVVTKEFMNDIGATNVNDILAYQVGSEGTRDFTATTGNLGRTSDGPAQDPSASIRGRGLAAYDVTRDYFYSLTSGSFTSLSTGTSVGFDPYNLDEVTISRGPNSILAGLGSAAGIINYSPQKALLDKDRYEFTYRFGSYGDQRATANANIVALKDVLAFRVAGEIGDQGFKQQPAYNHDRRIYLSSTWKPFSKTTIHVSYEAVRVHHELPNTLTPEDDVTQWLALGKPSYTKGGTVSPYLFAGQGGNEPTVFYNANGTTSGAFSTAAQYGYVQENLANVGIWQALRFNNNTYGDWQDLNTSASNALNRLNTASVSVDQEILPGLAINVAYVHEKLKSNQINLFRPDYVSYEVDVNQTLPTGAINPHYGETFMYFRGLDNAQNTLATNEAGRATATYNLDLNKYNPWFGRYSIVGFAEKRKTESDFLDYNAQSTDTGTTYFHDETGRQFYLGGNAGNGYTIHALPQTPNLLSNVPYTNDDGSVGSLSDAYLLKSDSKAITKLTTSALVFQGYLFKDMVIPMVGFRKDTDKAGFASSNTPDSTGFIPLAGAYPELDKISATTKSYGVVVHPLKWLSVFYNHSQNFIPNAGSEDLLGNPTPNPAGTSKDYGFSFDALNGKLNFKIDWFKTVAANGAAPTVNFPLVQWSLPFIEKGTGGAIGAFEELAQKAGVDYKQVIASDLVTGDPRLANAYTANSQSKGVEVELTYNVTSNWRIFANLTKQSAEESNIAPALTEFINARLKYWQSTPGLWTGQTTTKDWSGQPETGQQVFNNDVLAPFIQYQAADGTPSTQLHKWKAALVTNYTFDQSFIKGFSVGTGLRYLDGAVIGNPALYTVENGVETVTGLDLEHPYKTSSEISVDAWIGYNRTFMKKYLVTFQLRGEDLQEDGGYKAIVANSDGAHSVYAIKQPRSFFFTTKVDF